MTSTIKEVNNIVTFKATPFRKTFEKIYNARWWRAYAVNVIDDYIEDIEKNKLGYVSIFGYIPDIDYSTEYTIVALPEFKEPYGMGYRVLHITKKLENNYSTKDTATFLFSVIPAYASVLFEAYPDIMNRIINDIPIDYSKTRGIKEKTYLKIKTKIFSNLKYMEYIVAFNDIMSTYLIEHIYNKYPSVDEAKEMLSKNPYKFFCSLPYVGFIKADKLILTISKIKNNNYNIDNNIKTSKERCLACIKYLLEKGEDDGNSCLSVQDLREYVSELAPECMDKFVACLIDEDLYFNEKLMVVALDKVYKVEKYIADTVLEAVKKPFIYDIDISKYSNIDGYSLTQEQMDFLNMTCKNSISILNGCAGTGKSFTIKALTEMLKDNNLTFTLLAPTGKAAKVIREYTNMKAMTIHKWLGNDKFVCEDVIIIDEFSMVDIYIFYELLCCIDFKTTKLVIIGDNAQLLSVSTGNLLHEFIDTNIIPRVSLSKVFRYNDGGLMKVATDVRNGKSYFKTSNKNITQYGKDYYFIETKKENIVDNAVSLYKKLIGKGLKPYDIELLSAQKVGNYGTKVINEQIQKEINPYYDTESCVKIADDTYYLKDIVIQMVNNYHAKKVKYVNNEYIKESEDNFIANGEVGEIVGIINNHIYIQFNNEIMEYTHGDMKLVQLGYAITVHKAQGSSARAVIFITPETHLFMLSSNLIYVALTRTKSICFHLGNETTVKRAIKKIENIKRKTMMHELLLQTI